MTSIQHIIYRLMIFGLYFYAGAGSLPSEAVSLQ